MDILLTGGTGSIGRVLCQSLTAKGHRLTVLSRKNEQQVKSICGDSVYSIASLDFDQFTEFDAVINLAGEVIIGPRWTEKRKKVLWDSRVTLTEELVQRIGRLDVKPKVLINASAVGIYGNGGEQVLTEDSPTQGSFAHALCAAWEKAADGVETYGVRLCKLRIGLVLMGHGGMLKSMIPPFRLGLGGRIGDGQQWMPWVHIADLLAMIGQLLENPELSGVFNGVSPNPVRNQEFTASLARHLHRPAVLPMPACLLKTLMGEMGQLLLEGQQAIPQRFQDLNFAFRHPTLDSALTDIIQP